MTALEVEKIQQEREENQRALDEAVQVKREAEDTRRRIEEKRAEIWRVLDEAAKEAEQARETLRRAGLLPKTA